MVAHSKCIPLLTIHRSGEPSTDDGSLHGTALVFGPPGRWCSWTEHLTPCTPSIVMILPFARQRGSQAAANRTIVMRARSEPTTPERSDLRGRTENLTPDRLELR